MSAVKHTPAPWSAKGSNIVSGTHIVVGQINTPVGSTVELPDGGIDWKTADAEREANAALIAAAPELLALLQESTEFMTFDKGSVCIRVAYMRRQDELRRRINAAIAKAIGEQP